MPGPLYLRAVKLLGRRLKIPGDHKPPRVGRSNGVIENALIAARSERASPRLYSRGAALSPDAAEPGDLSVHQAQLLMMRRPENVYVKIQRRRRDIGTAMSVMRRIALRRPLALPHLPDDMIIGDPSGFDLCTVEKVAQPLSAFADNSAHAGSSD
jgi:hypothetical protein